jgi:cytochrome c553
MWTERALKQVSIRSPVPGPRSPGCGIAANIGFVKYAIRQIPTSAVSLACATVFVCVSALGPRDTLAQGDPGRGAALYAVCATCHGEKAEGMEEMNGPALAALQGWYLRRQLENFKSGARGSDSRDTYGLQMAPMAQLLQDDQAIADVVAYITSLK